MSLIILILENAFVFKCISEQLVCTVEILLVDVLTEPRRGKSGYQIYLRHVVHVRYVLHISYAWLQAYLLWAWLANTLLENLADDAIA